MNFFGRLWKSFLNWLDIGVETTKTPTAAFEPLSVSSPRPSLQYVQELSTSQVKFLLDNQLPTSSDMLDAITGVQIARTNRGREIKVPLDRSGKPVRDVNGMALAWNFTGRLVYANTLAPVLPERIIQAVPGVYEES